jgi:hypothetical protein
LSCEDLDRLEEVAPHGSVSGNRYPASMMSSLDR